MSGIFISGLGAVSPAGWGVENLGLALAGDSPLTPQALDRPGWSRPLSVLRVPAASPRPVWAAHPRMRRAAPISQFAMGAASEALGGQIGGPLGVVFCTTCGCVDYSRRFYNEVLLDPMVASPLLFPETVFNAPASHLSAVLSSCAANYTLVGDTGVFLNGLALAAGWLEEGRVGRCLVVAAEEVDWIIADALGHFRKSATLAEGAGAMLLTHERMLDTCAELKCVTEPQTYGIGGGKAARAAALHRVANLLPTGSAVAAETARLGEGFAASTAWQAVTAIRTAQQQRLARANVLAPGAYQEAIGACFTVSTPTTT